MQVALKNSPYSYPFGSLKPLRYSGGNEYRFGFIGAENANEISEEGNAQEHLFRSYDTRLGRYKSVDPLSKQFAALSPYQYAGNSPIAAFDLEGLEPATANPNTGTLILILQGYGVDPKNGKTQAQYDPANGGLDMTGLGKIAQAAKGRTDIQVVTYSSSSTENTKNDVKITIQAFKTANSGSKVIIVGHSGGGDNAVELAKDNPSLQIDLLILIDTQDPKPYGIDDNNITSNVKNVINYYQTTEAVGGERIDILNNATNGANILSPGSNHRSIDNDQVGNIAKDINNFISGKDAVGLAKSRTQKTYNPASSGSPNVFGNPDQGSLMKGAGTIKGSVNPASSRD
jgi:RHS repeat-associated protein